MAYTVKGLQPNSIYRFRVRAENIHGRSEPSLCSDVVKINTNHHGYNAGTEMEKMEMYSTDGHIDEQEVVIRQGGDFKSRFVLEEELGKGRFGVVHRVVERETGQILAAKLVKCIKAKDKTKVNCHL